MQQRLQWLDDNGYINNSNITYTRTTRFLTPLVGLSEFEIKKLCGNILINAYIKSIEEKLLYVILNKLDFPEESKQYVVVQNLNEHFIDYIDEEEEYILIYKIPEHFHNDYDKILLGEYSQTSTPYKEIIVRIYGTNRIVDNFRPSIYDCLFPTVEKRKLYANHLDVDITLIKEVSSKPNLDYEIYKPINKLMNYES